MSDALVGKSGSFKIGTTVVKEISEFSIDRGTDMQETTNFDSGGYKEYIPGIKEWSGSVKGNWVVGTDTAGQGALETAYENSTKLTGTFVVATGYSYTGDFYIKSFPVEVKVANKIEFSIDIQGTGALTKTV